MASKPPPTENPSPGGYGLCVLWPQCPHWAVGGDRFFVWPEEDVEVYWVVHYIIQSDYIYIYILYIWHIDIRDIYRQLEMWYIIVRKCRSYIICPIQDHTVSNRDMVSWFEYDMWNHATPYSTFFCETVKHPHLRMTCSSLWYMDVIPKPICNACAPTCRYLGIYTMSPPNHKKQRFWPPKNQVIYHKNL